MGGFEKKRPHQSTTPRPGPRMQQQKVCWILNEMAVRGRNAATGAKKGHKKRSLPAIKSGEGSPSDSVREGKERTQNSEMVIYQKIRRLNDEWNMRQQSVSWCGKGRRGALWQAYDEKG